MEETSGVKRLLGGWPVAFRRFILSSAVGSMAWMAFDGFLTPYLRQSGVSVLRIGYFYGFVGAVGVGAAALGGVMADRSGRRHVLVAAAAVRFLAWGLVLLLPHSGWLILSASLLGLGMAGGSAYLAYNAEAAPKSRRAFAFALTGALDAGMSMIVPPAIGILSDSFGIRTALFGGLVPAGLAILLVSRLPETLQRTGKDGERPRRPSPLAAAGFLLSRQGGGAAMMGWIWMFTGFQEGLMKPVWPMYAMDRFGVTYAGLGIVTTVSSFGMVLGQLIGGQTADRVGYARLMTVCLAASSALYCLVPVAAAPATYALILATANLVGWTAAPCWGAVGSGSAPQAVRGAVAGLHASLRSAGTAVGGVLSGVVYSHGIRLPFYVFAASDLTMFALVIVAVRAGLSGFGQEGAYGN